MLGATALALLAPSVDASTASAETVTLGSPLQELSSTSQCSAQPCALVQTALPQAGAHLISPVRGVLLSWHMLGGSSSFTYRLQVLSPGAEGSYTATGSTAPGVPTGPGLQTFLAAIPIQVGQVIAIELQAGAPLAYAEKPGAGFDRLAAPLANGATGTATPGSSFELGFNAEIVTGLAAGAAPIAVAPAVGSASSQPRPRSACKVPYLGGRRLEGAKKQIRKAGCTVGTVRKLAGVTAKTGVVVKQSPKPGKVRAPGAKVNVKLGQKR